VSSFILNGPVKSKKIICKQNVSNIRCPAANFGSMHFLTMLSLLMKSKQAFNTKDIRDKETTDPPILNPVKEK
jgi:hypothetical protein